jgi:glycosyltransferase involved in cell wall biosynthesis
MNVLFLSEYWPHDLRTDVTGVYQRMSLFIDALAHLGHLDMLFFVPSGIDCSRQNTEELERRVARHWNCRLSLTLVPRSDRTTRLGWVDAAWRSLRHGVGSYYPQHYSVQTSGGRVQRSVEERLERRPEIVFAHRLGAMAPLALTRRQLPPVFFDLDDLEHVKLHRDLEHEIDWKARLRHRFTVRALVRAETTAFRIATRVFACSETDRAKLDGFEAADRVRIVPNGVAFPQPTPIPDRPTLLFLGDYGYPPNVAAAQFLTHDVLPRVRRAVPKARLILAGNLPERIRGATTTPGVEVRGFVDDLDSLYAESRVVCCPVSTGSGMRIKVIEAAARSRPIVTTRVGAEGIDLADGVEILVRESPNSFAQACVELLQDGDRCRMLGAAARERASTRYRREDVVDSIRCHVREALGRDPI